MRRLNLRYPRLVIVLAGCFGLFGQPTAAEAPQIEPAVQLAASPTAASGLDRLKSVNAAGVRTLRSAGIDSLAKLAQVKPDKLAQVLKVDRNAADGILREANTELKRLRSAYTRTRSELSRSGGPTAPVDPEAEAYANLIAPENYCTILVRATCGEQNQCAQRAPCQTSKLLLDMYNSANDPPDPATDFLSPEAETCLTALSDHVVFNRCE